MIALFENSGQSYKIEKFGGLVPISESVEKAKTGLQSLADYYVDPDERQKKSKESCKQRLV